MNSGVRHVLWSVSLGLKCFWDACSKGAPVSDHVPNTTPRLRTQSLEVVALIANASAMLDSVSGRARARYADERRAILSACLMRFQSRLVYVEACTTR